jgi:hypothetical protein
MNTGSVERNPQRCQRKLHLGKLIELPRVSFGNRETPTHRVGRVLSFSPVAGIGTPPTPHPQASVLPPLWFRGEGHTRWRERGWESPNSNEWTMDIHCGTLYIYVLCAPPS